MLGAYMSHNITAIVYASQELTGSCAVPKPMSDMFVENSASDSLTVCIAVIET